MAVLATCSNPSLSIYQFLRATQFEPCPFGLLKEDGSFFLNKTTLSTMGFCTQVIGHRNDKVVVQIPTNGNRQDFLVINTAKKCIDGMFPIEHLDQPYLWECLISQDLNRLLLKPNLLFALKFRIQSMEDCVKVFLKDSQTGQ